MSGGHIQFSASDEAIIRTAAGPDGAEQQALITKIAAAGNDDTHFFSFQFDDPFGPSIWDTYPHDGPFADRFGTSVKTTQALWTESVRQTLQASHASIVDAICAANMNSELTPICDALVCRRMTLATALTRVNAMFAMAGNNAHGKDRVVCALEWHMDLLQATHS